MAVIVFFIKIETRKCSNMSQNVVNRLKMRRNVEIGDLVYALFCRTFTVDPNFLLHFQTLNNIFEYETPKNITLEPSHVAPQPP